MAVGRREILAGAGLACIAAVGGGRAIAQQPSSTKATPPAPPKRSMIDKLTEAASRNRHPLAYDGARFSGPGWDMLVREGAAAHFFLLGEEHGVAQIPALARELLLALKPSGYERLAIEISAPVAAELDKAALGGVDGIRRFIAEFPPGPAFYNMKEEAEMLAAVRPAFPASRPLLWGMDYEITQDRRLIARLKAKAPRRARAAVQALDDASSAAWTKFGETRNPQYIFSFAGDPQLVKAVRAAWPDPDQASALILDVLEATLEANGLWFQRKGWDSNFRRTQLMRASFVHHWRAEQAKGRAPRTFFKFGASHMARGRDMTEVYDIGDIAAEAAALAGGHSFHLFAAPAPGEKYGQFNQAKMTVEPASADYFAAQGVGFLADLAFPDGYTLIDLRPLRQVLGHDVAGSDPRMVRVVHGFDAMLILRGSTVSTMLPIS